MRIERINCNFICSRRKQERVLVGISGVKSHIFFVPFPHIIYRENKIFPSATICCRFFFLFRRAPELHEGSVGQEQSVPGGNMGCSLFPNDWDSRTLAPGAWPRTCEQPLWDGAKVETSNADPLRDGSPPEPHRGPQGPHCSPRLSLAALSLAELGGTFQWPGQLGTTRRLPLKREVWAGNMAYCITQLD